MHPSIITSMYLTISLFYLILVEEEIQESMGPLCKKYKQSILISLEREKRSFKSQMVFTFPTFWINWLSGSFSLNLLIKMFPMVAGKFLVSLEAIWFLQFNLGFLIFLDYFPIALELGLEEDKLKDSSLELNTHSFSVFSYLM